jgi:hypothetical protein
MHLPLYRRKTRLETRFGLAEAAALGFALRNLKLRFMRMRVRGSLRVQPKTAPTPETRIPVRSHQPFDLKGRNSG